jgi:hypothetical protein
MKSVQNTNSGMASHVEQRRTDLSNITIDLRNDSRDGLTDSAAGPELWAKGSFDIHGNNVKYLIKLPQPDKFQVTKEATPNENRTRR